MVKKRRLLVFSLHGESDWVIKEIKRHSVNFDEIIDISSPEIERENLGIKNLTRLNFDDFIDESTYVNRFKTTNEFILNISKEILTDNIDKEFLIEGINLWWFLPIRIFSILVARKTLTTLTIVLNILNKFKPEKVIFDSKSKNAPLIKAICKKLSIEYETNTTISFKIINKTKEIIVNLFAGLKRRIESRKLARWSGSITDITPFSIKNKNRIAFTFLENDYRQDFNIKGELKRHDIYQNNIQLKLQEISDIEITLINLINNPKQIDAFKNIQEEITKTNHIPLYYFYSRKLSIKSSKIRRILRRRLRKLFTNEKVKEAFTYEDCSLLEIYKFDFLRQFSTELVTGFEYIQLFRKLFKLIDPKVFVHYNENSVFGRAAIIAAKMLDLPIIALQHGNISFSSASAYFIYKDLICKNNQKELSSKCCHMSSTLSVYSKEDKKLLVEFGGFSKEHIVVTGCPRWDVILKKKTFQRDEFLENIGFDSSKKTIVVLSQPLRIKEYRNIFRQEVLESLKNKKSNLQIIWKPHPRENENEIKELIKRNKIKNIVVQKNLPLFQTLNACDIALTTHSTAGLEAMLFGKPLITLIPPGEVEAKLFKGSEAVLKVTNHKELSDAIDLLFNNEKIINQVKKGRDKLIINYLEFDGQASQRNAELILKFSK